MNFLFIMRECAANRSDSLLQTFPVFFQILQSDHHVTVVRVDFILRCHAHTHNTRSGILYLAQRPLRSWTLRKPSDRNFGMFSTCSDMQKSCVSRHSRLCVSCVCECVCTRVCVWAQHIFCGVSACDVCDGAVQLVVEAVASITVS